MFAEIKICFDKNISTKYLDLSGTNLCLVNRIFPIFLLYSVLKEYVQSFGFSFPLVVQNNIGVTEASVLYLPPYYGKNI